MNSKPSSDPLHEIGREISREDMLNMPVRGYDGEVCRKSVYGTLTAAPFAPNGRRERRPA
jgi:hypothetical protein